MVFYTYDVKYLYAEKDINCKLIMFPKNQQTAESSDSTLPEHLKNVLAKGNKNTFKKATKTKYSYYYYCFT